MAAATAFWITLLSALAMVPQPSPRNWANREEYELGSQALIEPDPSQRMALLQKWVARFPKTELERDRLFTFALTFQQLGEPGQALNQATQALALDPSDPSTLLFIAALGPTLPNASESQVATVSACAVKLLSISLSRKPGGLLAPQAQPTDPSASFVDPETQRVIAFIGRLRAARRPLPEPEVLKRQVAEAALQWAKSQKR